MKSDNERVTEPPICWREKMHPGLCGAACCLRALGKKFDIMVISLYMCIKNDVLSIFTSHTTSSSRNEDIKMNTDYDPRGYVRFGPWADRCLSRNLNY